MRLVAIALVAAAALGAAERPLDRLKREAAAAKAHGDEAGFDGKAAVTSLHAALREWIESRLPADESAMQTELKRAGLSVPGVPDNTGALDGPRFGYFDVTFKRLPEFPDDLFVIAGVSIPCGVDDAVYLYHFDASGWKRVIDEHPSVGYGYSKIKLSDPDSAGQRLLAINRVSVQCASTWMMMTYSVYRLPSVPKSAERLLSEEHAFWLGNDGPEIVLTPDELIVEFLDDSVDVDVHNRTEIQRFRFENGIRRLDPVAFQPQDFVEEWLTRPWPEMESRSAPETKAWHDQLHADNVRGEYWDVVPCLLRPGRWLIGLSITNVGEKELDDPPDGAFVVHELGGFHYEMEFVGEDDPPGCPNAGADPSNKHPWLSPEELKVLK
jgi:hypothetical protein